MIIKKIWEPQWPVMRITLHTFIQTYSWCKHGNVVVVAVEARCSINLHSETYNLDTENVIK
jgi:hypothetical protein